MRRTQEETGTRWTVRGGGEKTCYERSRSGSVVIKEDVRERAFKGVVSTKTDTERGCHLVRTVRDDKWFGKLCTKHTSHSVEESFFRISDTVKEVVPGSSKYCSKKTIENVIAKLGIGKEFMLDKSDAHSVDALVRLDDGKSFSLYKPMGKLSESFPEAKAEDFMLGYMCEKQRKMLVECMQSPIATLCIDSTHGTNAYHIKLTTLLTTKSLGSGVPVAFFFSTKEDEDTIGYFLSGVKKLVNELKPKVSSLFRMIKMSINF